MPTTDRRPLQILILEDNPADAELMVHELRRAGFEATWERVETREGFAAALRPSLDLILADYSLPQFDFSGALELVRESELDIPLIIVSGQIGELAAVEAMKRGAADYILKDRLERLGPAVVNALESQHLRDENQRAEAALCESEQRYRSIFENAVEGIFQTTLGGKCLIANPALARMLGHESPSELMISISQEFYLDPNRHAEFLRLMEAEGKVRNYESQVRRKDGSIIWISQNARAVRDDSGKLLYCEGMAEDITARKQAEDDLREVAHELKNSLTGIQAGLLSLRAGIDRKDEVAFQDEFLDMSIEAVRRLNRLLDTMLDQARLKAGSEV